MTVHEAIEYLEEQGSGNDEVMFRGRSISVNEIPDDLQNREAEDINITFTANNAQGIEGTLAGMVADRQQHVAFPRLATGTEEQ